MPRRRLADRAAALALALLVAGCGSEQDFQRIGGVWHYRKAPIPGADAASFQVLSAHYARDKARVYYADSERKGQEYYLVRHDRVDAIDGADAASFVVLPHGHGRDRASVYYAGRRLAVEDVASFEVLDADLARDRVRAYCLRRPIPGSHGASFVGAGGDYARDRSRAYHCGLTGDGGRDATVLPLGGEAPAALEVLASGYARTARRVFYRGRPVPGADAPTFTVPTEHDPESDARDARRRYLAGRPL